MVAIVDGIEVVVCDNAIGIDIVIVDVTGVVLMSWVNPYYWSSKNQVFDRFQLGVLDGRTDRWADG